MPISNSDNLFGFSPYIVDPIAANGSFTTIQSALTAANAAGGGIVYVRPGTYNENLTTFDNTEVIGIPTCSTSQNILINGVHTPPAAGTFSFRNLTLTSATSVFFSVAVDASILTVEDCFINIDGYIYDLFNWNGDLYILNCDSISSNNDGILNGGNAFGVITIRESDIGSGLNVFDTTMNFLIYHSNIGCLVNLNSLGGAEYTTFQSPVTCALGSQYQFHKCLFYNNIIHDSGNTCTMTDCTINTGAAPALAGTGIGQLTLAGITWTFGCSIISGLSIQYAAESFGSGIRWQGTVGNISAKPNEGWLILGGIAPVIITLPATAYVGDIVSISGRSTAWRLGQNAGQSVMYGILTTVVGVGGSISSTNISDQIEVICQVANTGWAVRSSQGNLTVV